MVPLLASSRGGGRGRGRGRTAQDDAVGSHNQSSLTRILESTGSSPSQTLWTPCIVGPNPMRLVETEMALPLLNNNAKWNQGYFLIASEGKGLLLGYT